MSNLSKLERLKKSDQFILKLWKMRLWGHHITAWKVSLFFFYLFIFFFLSGFSFTNTDNSPDNRRREGTIFYSTLRFSPAHEHWDIYLQLCMWDDYHVFLIATVSEEVSIVITPDLKFGAGYTKICLRILFGNNIANLNLSWIINFTGKTITV